MVIRSTCDVTRAEADYFLNNTDWGSVPSEIIEVVLQAMLSESTHCNFSVVSEYGMSPYRFNDVVKEYHGWQW